MVRGFNCDADCAWRVVFIQPAIPGDDRCIMLYGRNREIVGPLTMQLAEAWIDRFDDSRREERQQKQPDAAAYAHG